MKIIISIFIMVFLYSCTYPENDQRVSELENRVKELEGDLEREQRQPPQAEQVETEQSSDEDEVDRSKLLSSEEAARLFNPPHLNPELGVEIERREVKTDSQFSQYVVLTLRNNYSKTVRSLRIRNEWSDEREYERNGRVNTQRGYELVTVSIAPGQAGRVQLSGIGMGIYIEAVNFADGSMAMR